MTSAYPTASESRAALVALFEATREVIGGTSWEVHASDYGLCYLPDGSEGAEYMRQEATHATFEPLTVANEIAALWESEGYHGVTVEPLPEGTGYEVRYPKDADRVFFEADITGFAAVFFMSGPCIPGDADEFALDLLE
ncbi:hypothetical protein ACFRFH_11030 [Leifsonia sp. NPDC056824]|uniref:hypothetical protein n=1 Tax=Leifsonia sp. NPDC056824 TaxID=3345953 RepID=UPI0036D03D54